METDNVREQLAAAARLRSATITEAGRIPRGAFVVLAIATVLFFSSYSIDQGWVYVVAPIVWTAFIVAWVWWLRHGNRATPGRPARTRDERRRDIVEWIGLFVTANAIALLGATVSWILAGVLMAFLGAGAGQVASRRGRHT
jgi:hypothetical protein